jgi:NAD(P)-dependent dehydrogenase (short-subunit alcohol dehydrogenase family)
MRPENMLLTERVALVTGAAGGIGKAIALTYAAFGADVALVDLEGEEVERAAAAVRALGRRGLALRADVRKQADVDAFTAATVDAFGRIDILVNNVGGTLKRAFMDSTEEEWWALLDLNLVQVFRCTKAVVAVMLRNGTRGAIINVTTIEAWRAAPGLAPYAAAKAGLENFTRTLALELGPHGIRVNAISPDSTPTPGILKMRPDFLDDPVPPNFPLGRIGRPEDHAGAALYLASDLAAWVTGETIQVGGGSLAAHAWKRTPSGNWSLDGRDKQIGSSVPPRE